MIVEFEPTEEDWIAGFTDYGRRRQSVGPATRAQQQRAVVIFAALALLLMALPNFLPQKQGPLRYPFATGAGFLAAFAWLGYKGLRAFSPKSSPQMVRSALAGPTGKYMLERRDVEMNPSEVRERSESLERVMSWSRVPAVSKLPNHLVVYFELTQQVGSVTVIPRRAFRSDADFEDCCGLADRFWRAAHPEAVVTGSAA